MSKVWVIERYIEKYEDNIFMGIFSTQFKAVEQLKMILEKEEYEDDSLRIEEYNLDELL